MHNFIIGIKGIDHKDRNGLNNQRDNLRKATHTQNMWNVRKFNKCGYKGIKKIGDKYAARITINKNRIYLGIFNSSIEAAACYDRHALKNFGEFACINGV